MLLYLSHCDDMMMRVAEVQSSLGDEQDFLGSLLGSSNLDASPPPPPTAFIPAATSRPSAAAAASASASASSSSAAVLSVEEAADLQRRLDDMTDEQVRSEEMEKEG